MANNAMTITQLPQAQNVAATDLVLVVYNAASNVAVGNGSPSTRSMEVTNLANTLFSNTYISGPYANDSVAATANVALGALYYDTTGLLHVRIV